MFKFYCNVFSLLLILISARSNAVDITKLSEESGEVEAITETTEHEHIPLLHNDNLINNHTESMNISTLTTSPLPTTKLPPDLPTKGESENEKHYSLTIFFILLVVAIGVCVVHLLLQTKFHYLPESVAIVLIGTFLGLLMKMLEKYNVADWKTEESFPPTMFFLVLLPPIIFESGYNLHKGNFFQNIGTILVFAIFGTVLSAVVIGAGVFLLGKADVVYRLTLPQSFAFGSLVSAVDPVATLAIFHAIEVDEVLYMLVFGESVLNDAVSIVLTTTVMESTKPEMADMSAMMTFLTFIGRFCLMFFASAGIGVVFGLLSSLCNWQGPSCVSAGTASLNMLKFIDLRKTPSLELGMMLIFSYAPYGLAEGIHLSGIMAILFCGIVMSHYTHLNLSPVVQITTQLTFRTVAFMAETCVFAYLGLAIFSFPHIIKPALIIWSIILILIGRAMNILPLSFIVNYFREHKITPRMQFIMWFSGLRGAVSFALSLHLELESEVHHIIVSTTLISVLFTIVVLGGSTLPLMKYLAYVDKKTKRMKRRKYERRVTMSKTKEMGEAIDSEYMSELTEEDVDEISVVKPHLKGFVKLDAKYLVPFFTRRFTKQEVKDGRRQMNSLVKKWYDELREESEDGDDDDGGEDGVGDVSRNGGGGDDVGDDGNDYRNGVGGGGVKSKPEEQLELVRTNRK